MDLWRLFLSVFIYDPHNYVCVIKKTVDFFLFGAYNDKDGALETNSTEADGIDYTLYRNPRVPWGLKARTANGTRKMHEGQ
jgi:hypothetical protein